MWVLLMSLTNEVTQVKGFDDKYETGEDGQMHSSLLEAGGERHQSGRYRTQPLVLSRSIKLICIFKFSVVLLALSHRLLMERH